MPSRFPAVATLAFLTLLAGQAARCEAPIRTDRQGDSLPPRARARLGTTRLRHRDAAGMAVSPDGKLLVTSSPIDDANLRIWDLATGRLIRQVGKPRWARAIAFAPDGKTLAVVGHEGSESGVYFCQIATGWVQSFATDENQRLAIQSLAFSPDGKTLATGLSSGITLWDVATGKRRRSFARESDWVEHLAFSPDGKLLAANDSRSLKLWDAVTGRMVRQLEGTLNVHCLAFTPDGKFLAAGGWQDDVGLWEAATGKCVRWFTGHKESVASVAISPDGKLLATGGGLGDSDRTRGEDHSVRLWDIATGRTLHVLPASREGVFGLAFTPDGKTLISASELPRLWDVATGKRRLAFTSHEYTAAGAAFLPRGGVRTVSLDGTARTWESATGREVHRLALPIPFPRAVALSANGQRIACADEEGVIQVIAGDTGRNVRCWNRKVPVRVSDLSLSPDGSLLAVRESPNLRLYRVATGETVHTWHDHGTRDCGGPLFSSDGRYLAWANGIPQLMASDEEVFVYDLIDEILIRRIRLDRAASALAFSPDGRTLVIGEESARRVRGWEIASGKPRWTLTPPNKFYDADLEEGPMHLRFAPNGRLLAIGGGTTVQLWDTVRQERLHLLQGHQDRLADLVFSADGRLLASASWDSSTVIWDVPSAEEDRQRVVDLPVVDVDALWSDLGGTDAEKAFQAVHALAARPRQALAFLRQHLRPEAAADAQHITRLIADLDSDRFEVREKAQQELEQLGPLAGPALRRTLANRPRLEMRRRAEALLEKLREHKLSAEELQQIRAVEMLEHLGTAEARSLLTTLAEGAADAHLTCEARAALQRSGH